MLMLRRPLDGVRQKRARLSQAEMLCCCCCSWSYGVVHVMQAQQQQQAFRKALRSQQQLAAAGWLATGRRVNGKPLDSRAQADQLKPGKARLLARCHLLVIV